MDAEAAATPGNPDEHGALRRMQDGDRDALAFFYRLHRRPVYLSGFSLLRSRPDAEEVLQDTFVTMWSRRASIVLPGESALPWLLTSARNLALNRHRANVRRTAASLDEVAEQASASRGPASEVALAELSSELAAAIAQLGDTDRSIVELCLIEDLSYKQAAQRLGLSHAAVRNRLSRLRNRLRDTFSNPGRSDHGDD